jgi:hypothetical protein
MDIIEKLERGICDVVTAKYGMRRYLTAAQGYELALNRLGW